MVSMRLMMRWMHIYDNVSYARYLPRYWLMLKNPHEDITAHMEAGCFFSLTAKPFFGPLSDKMIEKKMNRGSKRKGGWIKLTQNAATVNIHNQTVNHTYTAINTLAVLANQKGTHKGTTKMQLPGRKRMKQLFKL